MKIQYSTDARVILATSFPVFREIVLEYIGDQQKVNQYMFDQQQMDQIFQSPHHFFLVKDIARVGVKLLELRKQTAELRNNLLAEEQKLIEAIQQIKEKVERGAMDLKTAKDAEKKLMLQNEKVQDSLHTVTQFLETEIKRLLGEFDNLMTKHDQEWREHRQQYIEKLIQELEQKNLLFSHEKEKLLRQETLQSLLEEFRG